MVVYAAIIQVGGRAIGADVDADEGWETARNVLKAAVIPIALSSVFVGFTEELMFRGVGLVTFRRMGLGDDRPGGPAVASPPPHRAGRGQRLNSHP